MQLGKKQSSRFALKREAQKSTRELAIGHAIDHYAERDDTPLEEAVDSAWDEAQGFVEKLSPEEHDTLTFQADLENALFCGHIMADLDSIAGAIGAALLHGGTAARASEINSETKFALKYWKLDCPASIEELLEEQPDQKVCLVDFQQQSQMNPIINMDNIVGVIDHHAIQGNAIVTDKPIFIDIRPWGSMSTILAHSFAVHEKPLPKSVAGILLAAILSDTLNLRSPTTTSWDKRMVSMLVQYIDPELDVNEYAAAQFRAKSHELSMMTPYQLVNGDTKRFRFNDAEDEDKVYTVAYGVIETTDAASSLARMDELIPEMKECRKEGDLTAMFLAVVDIVNMTSVLFIAGEKEASLAVAAYGGSLENDGKSLALTGLVSRKKDFIPALTQAFKKGWKPPKYVHQESLRRASHIEMDFSMFPSGRLLRVFDESLHDDEDEDEEKE